MKLKSIVIDDSKTQRTAVIELIRKHQNLDLVADYKNGVEAQRGMKKNKIDLVFLDIEMPIINGFEFIESLEKPPQIILITSKADYALQAFDYDVTDYLLKPITMARFNKSVKKALLKSKDRSEADENHIYVSSNLKKVKVQLRKIKWVEGMGDYIKVVTEDTSLMVLTTMKSFIDKLPSDMFLRIHKSYIINLEKVEKFNGARVEVAGRSIPLSRHKKEDLEKALLRSQLGN